MQQVIVLLRRYRWTIATCTFIVASACLIYSAWQPRLYCAAAKLAIYREDEASLSFDKEATQASANDEYSVSLETQLHVLGSRTLALGVVRKLELGNDPQFRDGNGKLSFRAPETPDVEAAATDVLLRGLSVRPVKQSRVVEVSFTGREPELAAEVVNTLVQDFIDDSIQSRFQAATRSANFLSGRLADLRARVEDAQKKLIEYERQHNIVGVDEKENVVTTKLDDLNKQLTLAESDRIEKESLYQTITSGTLDQIPETKSSEALQNLVIREAELKNEFAQANTSYGPNHPKVLELTNRIDAIDASIHAELKRLEGRAHEEYEASVRREQKLKSAFEAQKQQANRLKENAIQYGLLKRELDSNRQLYDNLQQRMKEAAVIAGLRSSNIRLIDAAETPVRPVSPNLPKSGSVGLFLGFLTSAAVIGWRESTNRKLRVPEEVEAFASMPALAVIPFQQQVLRARQDNTDGPICLSEPSSAMAEAYRALGTSIMLASRDLKTLVVTSSLPGEGKTLTAINCAVVLAQQGKRVLILDADLRKPTLHLAFNLSNQQGLTSILSGSSAPESAIARHNELPNIHLLPAGPAHSFPAELLGSAQMRDFLHEYREQYDYVILDTPPVLAVTDAIRVSSEADSILLVLRAGQTTREALARTCDVLNQAATPVLGIVVNGVNVDSAGSYYYSYYSDISRTYYSDRRQA